MVNHGVPRTGSLCQPHAGPAAERAGRPLRDNSAFINTDLATTLARCCDVVVYVGGITNNSIEATVRMSGNLGYESYVVGEGCWTVDMTNLEGRTWAASDVHAISLANLHGEYATVITPAEARNLLLTPID